MQLYVRPDQAEARCHEQSDAFPMRMPQNISANMRHASIFDRCGHPSRAARLGPSPGAAKLVLHVKRTKTVSSLRTPDSHGKKVARRRIENFNLGAESTSRKARNVKSWTIAAGG
jgi:hypothetical protein